MDWLIVNPFTKKKGLIKQSGRKVRNRPLTFSEEIALFDVCQPHKQVVACIRKKSGLTYQQKFHVDRRHLWDLVIASSDPGLRAGEVFNLRWWQIDLKLRVIYLTKEAAEQSKTGEPGILPMTTRLFDLFTRIYKGQRDSQKVFRRFDYRTIFENACREAGIVGLQFRDLRNTASNRMLEAGTPAPQVRKVTRHTTDEVFQGHYVSVDLLNAQKIGTSMDVYIAEQTAQARARQKAA
jgi:integrase